MDDRLRDHPLMTYLIFVLPALLLGLWIAFQANVLLIILTLAWLGAAMVILLLPVTSDDGSSA